MSLEKKKKKKKRKIEKKQREKTLGVSNGHLVVKHSENFGPSHGASYRTYRATDSQLSPVTAVTQTVGNFAVFDRTKKISVVSLKRFCDPVISTKGCDSLAVLVAWE